MSRTSPYYQQRKEQWKEAAAAKRAAGFRYSDTRSDDWLKQVIPVDTRSLTGIIMGDPIPGDTRTPWRPR